MRASLCTALESSGWVGFDELPKREGFFRPPKKGFAVLGNGVGIAEVMTEPAEMEMPDSELGVRSGAMRRASRSTCTGDNVCLHRGQTKR